MAKPSNPKPVKDYTIRLNPKIPTTPASNTRPWHYDPITEKQTRFLQFFGANIPETKGEANRMIAHVRINPDYKDRLKEYEKSKLPYTESKHGLFFRILKGSVLIVWKTVVWVFKRRGSK